MYLTCKKAATRAVLILNHFLFLKHNKIFFDFLKMFYLFFKHSLVKFNIELMLFVTFPISKEVYYVLYFKNILHLCFLLNK